MPKETVKEGKLSEVKVAPYGSWLSPIKADWIAAGTIRLFDLVVDDSSVYWIELRPTEAGRHVIVRHDADGTAREINPPPFNARTRVHEYGGASYIPAWGGVVFVNFTDQGLYHVVDGSEPRRINNQADVRYADFIRDDWRNRLIAVCEDHTASDAEPVNSIAAIYPDGRSEVLISGNDFYSNPRVSPDGRFLAFLTWNHPFMPWDAAQLWVVRFNDDGSPSQPLYIAGSEDESIAEPLWSPDGDLYFVSDRSNWWNIYRVGRDTIETGQISPKAVEPVVQTDAEFTSPAWVFGNSHYGFISDEKIICAYTRKGIWRLGEIDVRKNQLQEIETPYTTISYLRIGGDEKIYFIAGKPDEPSAVVEMDYRTRQVRRLCQASELKIDKGYISTPELIEFPTEGVFLCGTAHYPKHIREVISQAYGAASRVLTLLSRDTVTASGSVCEVDEKKCMGCGACISACTYGAIEFRETRQGKKAVVNPVICKGDGLCNSMCPTGAISLKHFTDEEFLSQIDAAVGDV